MIPLFRRGVRRTGLLLLGCLPCTLAAPARADWLVTRQGAKIETQGPWQEKGKLVVFTRSDGTLVSLRLTEVDLQASRAATRAAAEGGRKAAELAPAAPPPPARIKLSDKDFRHASAAPTAPATPDEGGAGAGEKPAALTVTNWDRRKSSADGHIEIHGTLRNTSAQQATSVTLAAKIFDAAGEEVGNSEAQLTSTAIPPGGSVGFVVDFPGVFSIGSARFTPRGFKLDSKVSPPAAIPTEPKLVFQDTSNPSPEAPPPPVP